MGEGDKQRRFAQVSCIEGASDNRNRVSDGPEGFCDGKNLVQRFCRDPEHFEQIYLCNLPTLGLRSSSNPTFGRTPPSFSSGPWINSHTQLQTVPLISSLYQSDATGASFLVSAKDATKLNNPRYLFTEAEIECLSRNAEEILQLHQHFVRELSEILEPLGFFLEQGVVEWKQKRPEDLSNLNAAIRAVSAKFATEVGLVCLPVLPL